MVDAQAIDATELIVSVRDRTGRYVLVNSAFEALTGLPRERLHGKRDAALNPQDIADKVATNDAQVFETGAPSEVDEELLGREGRVPVRSCRFAIVNDEGEPWAVCAVSASRDEAERIRAERDRLAGIADGTPIPHSTVTSKRLDALVADLATARETAAGLTEALEAERSAREEQAAKLDSERQAHAELAGQVAEATEELERLRAAATEAETGKAASEAALAETERARAEAEAARAEADAQREAAAAELERERAAARNLSDQVRSLEDAKHAVDAQELAAQLDAEREGRREIEAKLAEIAPQRAELEDRLAALGAEVESLRAEAAQTTAALEEARRDLERTRHELEAAYESLAAARRMSEAAETSSVLMLSDAASTVATTGSSGWTSLVWVQRRVADLVADASSFDSAMRSALSAFGELAGWDAVIGWRPARDGAFLRPANVWCSQAVAGSTFDVQSWQAILDDGPSAIAAAFADDETVWIEDASTEDRPRCRWAQAAGLTTAVAVPVMIDGERHGMIEAYRREPGPRDEDVVAVLETIATQLGGLERRLEAGPRWR